MRKPPRPARVHASSAGALAARNELAATCVLTAACALGAAACTRNPPPPSASVRADAGVDAAETPPLVGGNAESAVRRWTFELADVSLAIADAGMSRALDTILVRTHAELVVNGAFFDERGAPRGLAIDHGKILSPYVSTMSGGVFHVDGDRGVLDATEGFAVPTPPPSFAVQCRPRLVVRGKVNIRSDDGQRAERTALCLRHDGHTLDVVLAGHGSGSGPSLLALARDLAASGCDEALNLDGGPSTGAAFWDGATPELLAPRGPVRHAIVVKRR